MGTAVLFPQDCLRPRSRLKNRIPGMIYPLESAPRSRRNRSASSQGLETGLLPLPGHARHSSPMSGVRRGGDVKHIKARKAFDLRDSNPPSTAAPDISVCRILQRPKQGDSVTELLAHFAMLDKSGLLEEVKGSQVEGGGRCADMTAAQNGALGIEVDAFKLKQRGLQSRVGELSDVGGVARPGLATHKAKDSSGVLVSSAEGTKHSRVKVVHSKLENDVKEKVSSGLSAAKLAKAVGRNDMIVTGRHGEEQDKFLAKDLAQLRRTTTEPPMAELMVGQYTRRVMHISLSNPRLEAHARRHQFCGSGVDLSCEEKWAGPAYSSSPPPSSLPLPKLCLPHPKFTTVKLPPLIKQYSASVYAQSFLESSAAPFVASENGGAWDATFATESLRRLLNLDPY